jgi:hypothetical protein
VPFEPFVLLRRNPNLRWRGHSSLRTLQSSRLTHGFVTLWPGFVTPGSVAPQAVVELAAETTIAQPMAPESTAPTRIVEPSLRAWAKLAGLPCTRVTAARSAAGQRVLLPGWAVTAAAGDLAREIARQIDDCQVDFSTTAEPLQMRECSRTTLKYCAQNTICWHCDRIDP